MNYVPIFEKDGNKLFVLSNDFLAKTEREAQEIGIGAKFVECVLLRMQFTGETLGIEVENGSFSIPHVKCDGFGVTLCVISGPVFETAERNQPRKERKL